MWVQISSLFFFIRLEMCVAGGMPILKTYCSVGARGDAPRHSRSCHYKAISLTLLGRMKKISTPPHPSALLRVLGQRSHKCVNIYELASLGYTASMAACLHGYTSTWLTDSHLSIRTSQWVRKGFHANPSMTCGTHFWKEV